MRKPSTPGLLLVGIALVFAAGGNPADKVGEPAPDFTAKASDGKSYRVSDYRGKFVVLEWHNNGCPYTRKHYDSGNMQKLQKEWIARGVVWFTVISSASGKQGYVTPEEENAYLTRMQAAPTAALLDPSGEVGHLYNAKTTPQMVVINPQGLIIYDGAIIDNQALRIDNDHLRRGLCIVKMADLATGIQESGRRCGLHPRQVGILLFGRHVALFARGRGNDREPYDAARNPLLLELLHISAVVMLARVRATVVVPFKHDKFAAIIRHAVRS